jgi:hypothetical protein
MYIDRDTALRHPISQVPFEVERGRLRFFAKATGQADPVYSDIDAARTAGYPDLPVPPTFLSNSLELELPDPLRWLTELGGDLTKTTHAQQEFRYHKMAYAGDELVLNRRIVDVYTKKRGALEFVVKQTDIMRRDEVLAEVLFTIVLRHPEAAA